MIYWKKGATVDDDDDTTFSAITGPTGKSGTSGENAGFYAQYFQHSKIKWDIDFNQEVLVQ